MDKKDWKTIYRRVKSKPIFIKDGKPTSAIFKDSHGVSVNKDANRDLSVIIQEEERLHKFYNRNLTESDIKQKGEELRAIVSLTDEDCDAVGAYLLSDPIEEENPYHALLQKSETEIQLTKGQAKSLAKKAYIVKSYQ